VHYYFAHTVLENEVTLDQQESHHCTKVMRHKIGDEITLLDGKGGVIKAQISELGREVKASVTSTEIKPKLWTLTIAVSPTKSADRMEWMVEKLVEIGIAKIVFISSSNSERSKMQERRIRMKALAALKQSGNYYLPEISFDIDFKSLINEYTEEANFLAHCYRDLGDKFVPKSGEHHWGNSIPTLIAIGPEGDFTKSEVEFAVENGFVPLDLGSTRLRTETAAIVACTLFNH